MPSDVEKRVLTPQELLRLEREEQDTKKAQEADNEARDQFHLEQNADSLGLENTTTGKRRRITPKSNAALARHQKEEEQESLMNFFRKGASVGDIVLAVGAVASVFGEGLRTAFTPNARQPTHTVTAKDGSQIIFEDNIAVTRATQEAVENDQAILSAKIEKFQAMNRRPKEYEPGERMRFGRSIISLAQEFDMMRHPKTGLFIASIEKVEALEAKHKAEGHYECKGLVCVFRKESANGVNSRGIGYGVDISDVFDDSNPSEVKLTVKEEAVKEAKAPVALSKNASPAPGLRLS